jgi:hypothetical protein
MDQIDRWATELRTLRDAASIKRFRQRFDKATAQRIIRSPVLSEVDRAAISLTIQFSGPSRYGYADSCWFEAEEIGELSIPSPQPNGSDGNGSRRQPGPPKPSSAASDS